MTGTGTQNDPYIVDNWSDFITAVGTSSAYVELKKELVKTADTTVNPNKLYVNSSGEVQYIVQNSDLPNLYENTFCLDANDYAPDGITTTITITCASLNGNGATIKNLYSNSTTIITTYSYVSFEGIAFLNFRCTGAYFFISSRNSGWGTVSKCIFSGRMDGETTCYFAWVSLVHFASCAFNIQLYGSSEFAQNNEGRYDWLDFNECQIYTDDHRVASTYDYKYVIINSIWSGSYNEYISATMNSYDYTVYDLECASIQGNNSTVAEYIFVNSDKCTSTNGVQVTTAELQSASDLAAKGFPIQV